MNLRALIVEDEKNSQELLKELIEQYCEQVTVVGIAGSVSEARKAIESLRPELIFLDIQLPDGDGFQILEEIHPIDFDIIFTTAYDQYATRAFKFSATDYLLKPVDIEELQAAVSRVVEKKKHTPNPDNSEQIKALLGSVRQPNQPFKRIVLPTSSGFTVVNPDDIIRCESDRNYTFIFIKDGKKHLVSKTIKEYEEMLEDYNFFRIHQSHLINLHFLKNYIRGRGGQVELTDGTIVDVSARKKADFLRRMSATE